jgi:cell filamentation protein
MSDKYGVGQDIYCYPDSGVLINKLGITDQAALDAAELEFTQFRAEQYVPDFEDFSWAALRGIHFFLFQDIYSWAGEIRTVDISKGATRFANVQFIEKELAKLFLQLEQEDFLTQLPQSEFTARLAHYYSELNVIHPFRDGNGRVQRIFFEALAINAGYEIHWQAIESPEWLAANIAANHCQLAPLIDLLERSITKVSV